VAIHLDIFLFLPIGPFVAIIQTFSLLYHHNERKPKDL
jgi:lipopolysaccharide export LptBFGC system permease protein LptF